MFIRVHLECKWCFGCSSIWMFGWTYSTGLLYCRFLLEGGKSCHGYILVSYFSSAKTFYQTFLMFFNPKTKNDYTYLNNLGNREYYCSVLLRLTRRVCVPGEHAGYHQVTWSWPHVETICFIDVHSNQFKLKALTLPWHQQCSVQGIEEYCLCCHRNHISLFLCITYSVSCN